MKRWTIAAVLVLACGVAGFAQQEKTGAMPAAKATSPAFEKIKSLAGEWESTVEGHKTAGTYRVVSNGSAVENVIMPNTPEHMITMFHMDGQAVMATHYCAIGNQPRMVSKPSSDPNVIPFAFKDVTNLSAPGAGHMRELVITIVDADHHKQAWTFREDGKDRTEVFELTRRK